MHQRPLFPTTCAHLFGAACLVLSATSAVARAAIQDDVGFTALSEELGASFPTGAGITVYQIEAEEGGAGGPWAPDSSDPQFAGKTINQLNVVPSTGNSGHATAVARKFFGNLDSFAPGITDIAVYSTNGWFFEFFDVASDFWPQQTDRQIVNHSWISGGFTDASGNFSPSTTSLVLKLVDWYSSIDEVVQLYGSSNNNDYPADNSTVFMGTAFNGLLVGVSDFSHGYQVIPVDSTYVGGRAAIHVVVPETVTSNAAPRLSSATALLLELAKANPSWSQSTTTNRNGDVLQNAERVEVIKAALMAGASRSTQNTTTIGDVFGYREDPADQTDNGLDWRYGAGQLNVANSYHILAAGERSSAEDGGAGDLGFTGFDHDPNFGGSAGSNISATYDLGVADEDFEFTASLVWNLHVNGAPNSFLNFDTTAQLYNLDLELIEVGSGAVATSESAIDNTENIWFTLEEGKAYQLRVLRGTGQGNFNWDYGLAWHRGPAPPLAVPLPILMLPMAGLLLGLIALRHKARR